MSPQQTTLGQDKGLDALGHPIGGNALESLKIIEDETQQLDKLIGQLLTLTRLETDTDSTRRETVDLTKVLEEVAANSNFEARGSNRAVRVVGSDNCQTLGVTELLRSAIENVVRNAIHYTPEGTTVEINLRCATSDAGGQAVISVRDHGPGVAEKDLEHIFKPFYRVGNARDHQTDSTGLGLAITARAVSLHNGSVTARNVNGGGLLVEITLPLLPSNSGANNGSPLSEGLHSRD